MRNPAARGVPCAPVRSPVEVPADMSEECLAWGTIQARGVQQDWLQQRGKMAQTQRDVAAGSKVVESVAVTNQGTEVKLEAFGRIFLAFGLLGGGSAVYLAGSSPSGWAQEGVNPIWLSVGLGAALQGAFFYILLYAAGDVVRLLKKQNGIAYEGEIIGLSEKTVLRCWQCRSEVDAKAKKCRNCSARFDG